MYSYKINNSYTIYVNYEYINECIKAGKKKRAAEAAKAYTNSDKETKKKAKPHTASAKKPKKAFTPLSAETMVSHKVYGLGRVVSTDKNGIMDVAFKSKTTKFLYPDAINQGYLKLIK